MWSGGENYRRGQDDMMVIESIDVATGEDDCRMMCAMDDEPLLSGRVVSWRSSSTGRRGWSLGWCTPGRGTPGRRARGGTETRRGTRGGRRGPGERPQM